MKFIIVLLFVLVGGVFLSCSDSDEKSKYEEKEPQEPLPGDVEDTGAEDNDDPRLLSMKFAVEDNLFQLTEDENCDIIGDSIVECWIRHIIPNKVLKATIEYNGSKIVINGIESTDDIDFCDYSKPVNLSVYYGERHKDYIVNVHTFTGLPIVWIETHEREPIISKTDYVNATFKLEENVTTRGAGEVIEGSVRIRGRGNSSWRDTNKKSYRLKFDEKVSLLDGSKDKSWLLLANSFDKTMIRNHIAYFLGNKSLLDYTPAFKYVDLMLNGNYVGTYMLGENLKISSSRVNVGKDGFLLEVDERAPSEDEPYFQSNYLTQPINIKDPKVVVGDEDFNYIKDYVQRAEDALFSDKFMDENEGWQRYMDMDSFVDWYIINEIARNYDALFLYTSCFINLKRGGKLKMGPIWDFDVTFGNNPNPQVFPIEGLSGDNSIWFSRLFQDPLFRSRVKKRYEFYYGMKDDILREIDQTATYLKYSIEENNNRWNVLYYIGYGNRDAWGCYQNEVQYLKKWINDRMEWLNNEFTSY